MRIHWEARTWAIFMLLVGVISNGEQKELLIQTQKHPSLIHLNLDTCQNSTELKHSSYFHLFQSIINMSHHHLMLCAFRISKRSLISSQVKWGHRRARASSDLLTLVGIHGRKWPFGNKHPARMQLCSLESAVNPQLSDYSQGMATGRNIGNIWELTPPLKDNNIRWRVWEDEWIII